VRYLKWEFYLARLDIRGVPKLDSFLTFLSGFVLTVTPGKIGEVFKSLVLFEIRGVAIARTAPIVVAERVTDLIGIITLIILGSLGFSFGLVWAGAGTAVVVAVLVVIASPRLSNGVLGLLERMPGPIGRLGPKFREAYASLATLLLARNLLVPTLLPLALGRPARLRGVDEHQPRSVLLRDSHARRGARAGTGRAGRHRGGAARTATDPGARRQGHRHGRHDARPPGDALVRGRRGIRRARNSTVEAPRPPGVSGEIDRAWRRAKGGVV
jgi:hypothetical protein